MSSFIECCGAGFTPEEHKLHLLNHPNHQSEPHKVGEPMNELEAYRHLQQVEAEHALFQDTIKYMAENAHQAYHQDSDGGWWVCPKNICTAAQRVLPKHVLWLSGKGPKP